MTRSDIDAIVERAAQVNASDEQVREATGIATALGIQKALEYLDRCQEENTDPSNGGSL